MKKILFFAAMLLAGLTFTACSDDNPVNSGGTTPGEGGGTTPATQKCDIVLMYYGIGGSNLDQTAEEMLLNVVEEQDKHANVRTFVQFKYSKERDSEFTTFYAMSGDYGCAYRFEANAATANLKYWGSMGENWESGENAQKPFLLTADMKVGDGSYKMYDPQNLAAFMNWCRQQAPDAKVYVLAFGDHGGGYNITKDYDKSNAQTRGVMYDDNIEGKPCMSPTEIATAINSVNKKIDMVFFDCCIMNNLEVLGELQATNLVDYVFASGHDVSHTQLSMLCTDLSAAFNKGNYLDGAKQFVTDITKYTEDRYLLIPRLQDKNKDYTLTDLSKLPTAFASIKAVADYLSKIPEEELNAKEEGFSEAAGLAYQYVNNRPLYDMGSYLEHLEKYALPGDNTFKALADKAVSDLRACQVAHQEYNYISDTEKIRTPYNLTYSVTLGFTSSRLDFSRVTNGSKDVQKQGVIMTYIKGGQGEVNNLYYNDYFLENGLNYYSEWSKDQEVNVLYVTNYDEKGSKGAAYKNWKATYCTTIFDKSTGWSNWMRVNTGIPYDNPPKDDEGNVVLELSLEEWLSTLEE